MGDTARMTNTLFASRSCRFTDATRNPQLVSDRAQRPIGGPDLNPSSQRRGQQPDTHRVGTLALSSWSQFRTTETVTLRSKVAVAGRTTRNRPSVGDTSYGLPDTVGPGRFVSNSFVAGPTLSSGESCSDTALIPPSGST